MNILDTPVDIIVHRTDPRTGRRGRVAAAFFQQYVSVGSAYSVGMSDYFSGILKTGEHRGLVVAEYPITLRMVLDAIQHKPHLRSCYGYLSEIMLSKKNGSSTDAELHIALQDLGDEINWDIHEACEAFSNPDLYYPGAGKADGIEPVSNVHVETVIKALQRELSRELRAGSKGNVLPAVRLEELPWRIQRALVERRRLRYHQYGITKEAWQGNKFSLWDIPEDPDFLPRRIKFGFETVKPRTGDEVTRLNNPLEELWGGYFS